MTLSGLCSQNRVTRADVDAVLIPKARGRYKVIPYGDQVDLCTDLVKRELNLEPIKQEFGLSRDGGQFFAVLTYEGNNENGMAFGLRGSYNKTLANACASGASVFVCDNLMFEGSAFKVVRKNTTNCFGDFRAMLHAQVKESYGHYKAMNSRVEAYKALPCAERRGYAMLGVALGEGVLTPTQATVAFGDWKKPRHAEFSDRNLWSLYNCVTEGLKKGPPAKIMGRTTKATEFFDALKGL